MQGIQCSQNCWRGWKDGLLFGSPGTTSSTTQLTWPRGNCSLYPKQKVEIQQAATGTAEFQNPAPGLWDLETISMLLQLPLYSHEASDYTIESCYRKTQHL